MPVLELKRNQQERGTAGTARLLRRLRSLSLLALPGHAGERLQGDSAQALLAAPTTHKNLAVVSDSEQREEKQLGLLCGTPGHPAHTVLTWTLTPAWRPTGCRLRAG